MALLLGVGAQVELPQDMSCSSGPHAKAWGSVKELFNTAVVAGGSPMVVSTHQSMAAALDAAMEQLTKSKAFTSATVGECAIGRLCLQLLTLAARGDAETLLKAFSELEQIASPTLTVLLDVPWLSLAQSGWPVFGLLSQMNLHKHQVIPGLSIGDLDGTKDPLVKLFRSSVTEMVAAADLRSMDKVATAFLDSKPTGSAMAIFTAVAVQAAAMVQPQARAELVQALQKAFRQMVGSAEELDLAMSTQWPMWGLLHISVAAFDFR